MRLQNEIQTINQKRDWSQRSQKHKMQIISVKITNWKRTPKNYFYSGFGRYWPIWSKNQNCESDNWRTYLSSTGQIVNFFLNCCKMKDDSVLIWLAKMTRKMMGVLGLLPPSLRQKHEIRPMAFASPTVVVTTGLLIRLPRDSRTKTSRWNSTQFLHVTVKKY